MIDFLADIENCLEVLKTGGTILYPTDTVWGLGCDATDVNAVEKLFHLKKRPGNKTMIILLADERDILKYVAQPDPHIFDYLQTLEKPTTIIYNGGIGVADSIIGEDGTIGIRITKEAFTKHLIKRLRRPLVSTSANIAGLPTPRLFEEIEEDIKKGVDYIVKYRQWDWEPGKPSTLVKWNFDGTITELRR